MLARHRYTPSARSLCLHACGCGACVPTTVMLDEDVAAALRGVASERGLSLKELLNATLREGLSTSSQVSRPYRMPVRSLGLRPGIDLDKALDLAGSMEDDEVVRKLEMYK